MPRACAAIRAGGFESNNGRLTKARPTIISAAHLRQGPGRGRRAGVICLPRLYRDFLVNRGRAFIYSTAPSPLMAAVVRASLKVVAGAEQERAQLSALVRHAEAGLRQMGLPVSGSQIQPVIIGEDGRAMALAGALQARGHDIRAIRPPTVPEGTARLRLAPTLRATAWATWTSCLTTWRPRWRGHEVCRPMRFVVTGTDTNIGKTIFCAGLCGFLGARYWKPVQSGLDTPTDGDVVAELAGVEIVPEAFRLKLPASPHQSMAQEDVTIDHERISTPPDGLLAIEVGGRVDGAAQSANTLYIDVFPCPLANSSDPVRPHPARHHQPHIVVY